MSMYNQDLTKQEVEGLLAHGLTVGNPSQLSDAFILGMRFEKSLSAKVIERIKNRCEFHIRKLLKHNDICSHDREMMRQLLSYIKDKVEE